ncbi:MAG TPA: sulfatase [Pirellulales bacterium]|nr:sulfatase [Pirellulales bacterium]
MNLLFRASLVLCAIGCAASQAADRPNVLLLCVDDLKPALGCYGDPVARSPNVDRLAARGMRFDRAYCNQAVCAPSRNALLTGLRPQTLGIYDLATNFRIARPDAITLPQAFMQQGYRTESLGKVFHVGHGNTDDKPSWSVPSLKVDVVAYALTESHAAQGLTREEALFANTSAKGLPRGAAYESAEVDDDAYPDGRIADEAARRLKAAAQKPGEPFFLAVGFVKPHLPFCAPKRYWALYDRSKFQLAARQTPPEGAPSFAPQFGGELRQYKDIPESGPLDPDLQRTLIHGYYAAMSYMDAQLGKVLDALEATGLAKNTIVVLWGDHGWHLGDHGMWCKHTNYEQAARIPLIVAGPHAPRPGTHSDALVETVDIYPTLCELAGFEPPSGLDGRSFVAVLRDKEPTTRDSVIHVYPRNGMLGRAIRTKRYRLVEWKRIGSSDEPVIELYDYKTDPDETKNVAREQPAVVADLLQILDKHPAASVPVHAPKGGKAPASR